MKWSWKIGQFAGIGVYMHVTFLLLIGWVALSYWLQERSVSMVISGIAFILAIFACVVAHEYGHALTARRYGIRTRDITLLPIGGLARLERMPDDPRQELWVALAGPAVNVVIAVLLYIWLELTGGLEPISALTLTGGSFAERLILINLFLVGFNMLPAFPMDGGRVLRALLATRMEYTRATQLAAHIGQGMAFLFGFIGLFANPLLLFIAFFVWIGAAQEASMTQMRSALGGIPVTRAMLTDFQVLSPHDPLARAVELILSGSQHDFPVTVDGHVVGVLTRQRLMQALAERGRDVPVSEVMEREVETVEANEMLEAALSRLQTSGVKILPILHRGALVGLLTSDNVGEFLMIQSALERARPGGRSRAYTRAG